MIYDITPPAGPDLAVFPGDTPLAREIVLALERGDPVTLSTLRATCHLGAHVDAPSHYGPGATVDALPLERYLGTCRLVRPRLRPGEPVTPDAVQKALGPGGEPGPRLLVATGSYPDPSTFTPDFAALAPELIDWLAGRGGLLIGVDTPSIDPADSNKLPSHKACLRHDVSILEGLLLSGVPEGEYELIALPLRLVGFDGSPVRAILRSPETSPGGY